MCSHEAHDHNEHEHGDEERGLQFSLYQKVDLEHVECLNEEEFGSGKHVFKPWEDRLDRTRYISSDVDEELLLSIPFTGMIKLKGMIVIGGEAGSHPRTMRLYKNRPRMSFDDTSAHPDQVFDLTRDEEGSVEYGFKVVKFASVHHLTIHIPDNFGADSTKLYYIGLRGEFLEAFRDQAVIATYEARPMPQDHKGSLTENMRHEIS